MKRKTIIIIIILVLEAVLLAGAVAAFFWLDRHEQPAETTAPTTTAEPTTVPTTVPPTTVPPTTVPPTTEAETVPPETTEPEPEVFTLTFVGDCTLGSAPDSMGSGSFVKVIGEDYGYPFRNVAEYFHNDDATFINLEGVFAEEGDAQDKLFTFRGPLAYGNILTEGSVEAVTLANNHIMDFGEEGLRSTRGVLDGRRIHYAQQDGSVIFNTKSGLRIGMYAVSFQMDKEDMAAEVAKLRENGAEIVILALHAGKEGSYRPTEKQKDYARAAIDAGVDIVWGHHSHRLQPIEEYNGGIIYYGLGNFSFGGNRAPSDMDTVIVQQQIIREPDGTVRRGELTLIPCSMSSAAGVNNYQPTPYEPDSSKWKRALTKLDGTYTGPDYIPSYDRVPETTATAETTAP